MRRIIYLCPADNVPTGGIKVIYRHVERLSAFGLNAFVLHPFDLNFTCTWFDHHAPILRSMRLDPANDFVIIPELWAATFGSQCINQHVRFGIFVQNGYLTHPILEDQPLELFDKVYQTADLILSISDDSACMVSLNYPRLDQARLVRVRYSINNRFMTICNANDGTAGISFMPRKMSSHAALVVAALRQHLPRHWRIAPIHNVNEATVATMLAASRIFLSFSEFEGLPLPPIEAALAGNLVIGYTGQGAREYWDPPNFQEIHQGDIRAFVTATHRAALEIDASRLTRATLAPGIERLKERFSPAAEDTSLRGLLDRIDRCFRCDPVSAFVGRAA